MNISLFSSCDKFILLFSIVGTHIYDRLVCPRQINNARAATAAKCAKLLTHECCQLFALKSALKICDENFSFPDAFRSDNAKMRENTCLIITNIYNNME